VKKRPKCSSANYFVTNNDPWKKQPKIWATSVIFKKLPKLINCPKGKNFDPIELNEVYPPNA
jgi:hypothetical protein